MQFNTRTIISFILLLILLWFIWQFYFIIAYFLIAAILSILGRPLADLFCRIRIGRFKVPNTLGAVLTLITFFIVMAAFISIFIPLVVSQARIISSVDVEQIYGGLKEPMQDLNRFLSKFSSSAEGPVLIEDMLKERLGALLSLTSLSNITNEFLSLLGNIFVAFFSILFITFFFLRDKSLFYNIVLTLTPDSQAEKVKNILRSSKSLLTRYFYGLIVQITLFATVVSIGLLILGIDYALIIAFFGGIMNIIPYVGPIIGLLFGVFVTITTSLGVDFYAVTLPLIIKVAVVFQIAQLLDNYLFGPLIFSNSVNAHPLEIFFVVLIAGFIAGIPGMIAAIPVYTLIRIIAKEFLSEFKFVKSITKNI